MGCSSVTSPVRGRAYEQRSLCCVAAYFMTLLLNFEDGNCLYMRANRQGSSRSPTDTEVHALRESERQIKKPAGLCWDVKIKKGSKTETDQTCKKKTSGDRAQVLQLRLYCIGSWCKSISRDELLRSWNCFNSQSAASVPLAQFSQKQCFPAEAQCRNIGN